MELCSWSRMWEVREQLGCDAAVRGPLLPQGALELEVCAEMSKVEVRVPHFPVIDHSLGHEGGRPLGGQLSSVERMSALVLVKGWGSGQHSPRGSSQVPT